MIQSPKGMHDMLFGDIRYLEKILERAREISEFYGFLPIQTPHLEQAELFLRPCWVSSCLIVNELTCLLTDYGIFVKMLMILDNFVKNRHYFINMLVFKSKHLDNIWIYKNH